MSTTKPWYAEGLPFKCVQCGECCTGGPGYVWLTVDEAAAIARHLRLPLDAFARRHLRRAQGRLSLTERHDSSCVFYDDTNKSCRIYKVRPTQCRSYPFWPRITASREAWESEARGCPGIGEDAHVDASTIVSLSGRAGP